MGNIGIPNGIAGGPSDGNGTFGRFEDEKTITKVIFGNDCTFVGNDAFENCESLSEINTDNKIQKIGSRSFAGTAITSVEFKNLTELGESAFEGCKNLQKIVTSESNDISIPAYAFKGCEELIDIKLDNCSYIGESAFEGCKKLQKINLRVCEKIGKKAFRGCDALTRVYIYKNNAVCELEEETTDSEKTFNKDNVVFYIHQDIFDSYENNEKWNYYTNKVKMVQNNQIIYTTTNGKKININDNTNIAENKYENGYGLIQFNEYISQLNSGIFGDLIDGSDSDSNSDSNYLKTVDLPESFNIIGENAFSGCENLIDITLSDSLEKIENFAFRNCKSLTSFTIPQSVTTLGEGIFAGCKNIKKIEGKFTSSDGKSVIYNRKLICVLPNNKIKLNINDINKNITSLGNSCFYGCKNLRRIDIPSNVTEISSNAFDGCENLQEIHFLGSVPPKLNYNIIKNHNNLKIFVPRDNISDYYKKWENLGENLNNIYPMPETGIIYRMADNSSNVGGKQIEGTSYYEINIYNNSTFANKNVKVVILSPKITDIPFGAFKNCSELNYIYMSNKIKFIYTNAFSGCTNLASITIPDSVTSIGSDAFSSCASLTSATIGNSVTTIGGYAFGYCSSLTSITIPNSVTTIGSGAFSGCTNLASITIPNSVILIGENAFENCPNLPKIDGIQYADTYLVGAVDKTILSQNINIKEGTRFIGNSAFSDCTSLKSVTIPDSVTWIGRNAFYNCTSLERVYITNLSAWCKINFGDYYANPLNYGAKLYLNGSELTNINIPSNITNIKNYAFYSCSSLTSVTIPNSVTSIGERVFYNCTSLKNVTIGNSVTSIGKYAFYRCTSLTSITIPDSVTEIGEHTFNSCTSLTSITIPDSVTSIGNYAFRNCDDLTSITIPNSVTEIGYSAFEGCESLTSITIPDSVTEIGDGAFCYCTKLTSITIPISVTKIRESTFEGCTKLTSITIPISVTKIGNYAFYNCTSLKEVYCNPTTPPTGDRYMFEGNASGRKIYVPIGTTNAYRTATYWKDYASSIVANRYIFNPGLTPDQPSI